MATGTKARRVAKRLMHPRRLAELDINQIEGGFVIYQADRDRAHYLNHSAVVVLEFCDGRRSVSEIAECIRKVYDLGTAARRDVEDVLAKLAAEGLVSDLPVPGSVTRGAPRSARRRNA
jgi:Coenzyme PQQ synthesis protein D (PqqD)